MFASSAELQNAEVFGPVWGPEQVATNDDRSTPDGFIAFKMGDLYLGLHHLHTLLHTLLLIVSSSKQKT